MAKRPANSEKRVPETSSVARKLPAKQEALFREVLTIFEREHLPYAVAGAFALRQHTGICRYTKDLDVFLSAGDASAALQLLQANGFECEVRDPVWLAKAHRDDFFVDLITGMSNGVLAVDASWIERARPATVMGVKTRVLAPEELLASKLFVIRRERFDGADIAHIVYASRGELQWDRVLQLAGEHWEILLWVLVLFHYVYPGQAGYVPESLWRDLIGRLKREVSSPDENARFRGSLVDDKMFAIDLKEWGLANLLEERRAQCEPILLQDEERCA
jgi:hypothetical protein